MNQIPERLFFEKLIAITLLLQVPLLFVIVMTNKYYLLLIGFLIACPIFFIGKTHIVDLEEIQRRLDIFGEIKKATNRYVKEAIDPLNIFIPLLNNEHVLSMERFPDSYYSLFSDHLKLAGGASVEAQFNRLGGAEQVNDKLNLILSRIDEIQPILEAALEKEKRRQAGHML